MPAQRGSRWATFRHPAREAWIIGGRSLPFRSVFRSPCASSSQMHQISRANGSRSYFCAIDRNTTSSSSVAPAANRLRMTSTWSFVKWAPLTAATRPGSTVTSSVVPAMLAPFLRCECGDLVELSAQVDDLGVEVVHQLPPLAERPVHCEGVAVLVAEPIDPVCRRHHVEGDAGQFCVGGSGRGRPLLWRCGAALHRPQPIDPR